MNLKKKNLKNKTQFTQKHFINSSRNLSIPNPGHFSGFPKMSQDHNNLVKAAICALAGTLFQSMA